MTVFRRHPGARWTVPATAAALVAGGVGLGAVSASAAPLPDTTAAELLARVHDAAGTPVSGTVSWTADLGLPDLASAGLNMGGAELTTLLAGDSTLRVWTDGEHRSRVDLLGRNSERRVTRDGSDVWAWSSEDATATHLALPTEAELTAARDEALAAHGLTDLPEFTDAQRDAAAATLEQCVADAGLEPPAGAATTGHPEIDSVPATPQEAAEVALAHLDPTTEARVEGQTRIAGRDAYELVLDPRDEGTRIDEIRLAVDGETGVPLRVQVVSTVTGDAAVEVGFTTVSFDTPDAAVFTFTPPAGATVEEVEPKATGATAHGTHGPTRDGQHFEHPQRPEHPDVAPAITVDPATGAVTCDPAALRAAHDAHAAAAEQARAEAEAAGTRSGPAAHAPEVIGDGWDTIVVSALPEGALGSLNGEPIAPTDLADAAADPEAAARIRGQAGQTSAQVGAVIDALPRVTGDFGSARVLDGPLVSVVITDDGRVAAGAVAPQDLLDALA